MAPGGDDDADEEEDDDAGVADGRADTHEGGEAMASVAE